MKKEKEVELLPKTEIVPTYDNPTDIIKMAIDKGANLDQLEKLLALRERFEITEARKAYHKAMTAFKANAPKIDKDKTVAYGNTKYNHASLGNVVEKIGLELSKHGLSASWTTQQNGTISVTCKITHVQGHSEETTLSAGADTSGAKNSIQALGSTLSYLERYSLLALTGLATYDMDDDAITAETVELITPEQAKTMTDLIATKEVDTATLLKFLKVDAIEKIKVSDYQKAIEVLKARKSKKVADENK